MTGITGCSSGLNSLGVNPNAIAAYILLGIGQMALNRIWSYGSESKPKVAVKVHEAVIENPQASMKDIGSVSVVQSASTPRAIESVGTGPQIGAIATGVGAAVLGAAVAHNLTSGSEYLIPPSDLTENVDPLMFYKGASSTPMSTALVTTSKGLVVSGAEKVYRTARQFALPLIGAPFIGTGSSGSAGASGASSGAAGAGSGTFSGFYSSFGSAFKTAGSAFQSMGSYANSLWANASWGTTLGVGAIGLIGAAYLARRYFGGCGCTNTNTNTVNPTFNYQPKNEMHLHVEAKEGTKIIETTDENGNRHYNVISTPEPRLKAVVHRAMQHQAAAAA